MKKKLFSVIACGVILLSACAKTEEKAIPTVKDHFKDSFLIGAAIPVSQVRGFDPKADSITTLHFNSVVAENCMKNEVIHPQEGVYFWDDADKFIKYGEDRDMTIIGHCLIWHSQLAPWFPLDSAGNYVSPEVLKERMKDHISTVVGRYKGKVHGWDVVNEAILDNGEYRKSPFYEILGEEFIPLAFQYAHEADPDAELYLNDYSMSNEGKRDAYVKLINQLKERGLRIDAIGMQSHVGMDYPSLEDYEKSMDAFAGTGVKIMITELDMSALPTLNRGANISDTVDFKKAANPYPDGLPQEVSDQWNKRMAEIFDLYKKHADDITRVTFWGPYDGMSWKNGWPVPGRKDYPLLFDRDYQMKPFMVEELAKGN